MPAAARKPPQQSSTPDTASSSLPSWLVEDGFVAFPFGFFTEASRRLTYAGFLVFGAIYEDTIGGGGVRRPRGTPPPEWTEPTHDQYAARLGLSRRAIVDAFKEIDPLIDAQGKNGCGLRYRIKPRALQNLAAIAAREPRKKTKTEPKPAPAEAKPIPASLSCPLGQECPVTEMYESSEGQLVNIRESDLCTQVRRSDGNLCTLVHRSEPQDGPPRPVLVRDLVPDPPAVEAATEPVLTGQPANFTPVDPREELRRAIKPVLVQRFPHIPPRLDDKLCDRTLEALDGTPVDELARVMAATSPERFKSRGLIPHLAEDARHCYRERCLVAIERTARPRDTYSAEEIEEFRRQLADPTTPPQLRQALHEMVARGEQRGV